MLFPATITKIEKVGLDTLVTDATNGTTFILNGNRAQGLQVRASTKSSFMYTIDRHNHKEKAAYVEANESCATLRTDMDKTTQSLTLPLYFYTDNDISLATFLRYINVDDIAYCYRDKFYPETTSWVVYYEGGKKKELRCYYSLYQIFALADAGVLTTAS